MFKIITSHSFNDDEGVLESLHAIIMSSNRLRYLMLDEDKKETSRKKKSLKAKPATAKKVASKTRKISPKTPEKKSSLFFQLFTGGMIAIFIAFGVKFYMDQTYNPMIGKWRTQTSLGIMEVEFEKNSMSVFGTKTPISYDIQEKSVIVFDDTIKIGNTYKLIDKNTISTESGGFKTVYKRVK